uniref:DUF4220 domain-containing protein n=1 Tax=Oryza glaberrima TaxID=4538 RepID=I1NME3_ORYGL
MLVLILFLLYLPTAGRTVTRLALDAARWRLLVLYTDLAPWFMYAAVGAYELGSWRCLSLARLDGPGGCAADGRAGAATGAAGSAAHGEEAREGERRRPAPEKGREAASARPAPRWRAWAPLRSPRATACTWRGTGGSGTGSCRRPPRA